MELVCQDEIFTNRHRDFVVNTPSCDLKLTLTSTPVDGSILLVKQFDNGAIHVYLNRVGMLVERDYDVSISAPSSNAADRALGTIRYFNTAVLEATRTFDVFHKAISCDCSMCCRLADPPALEHLVAKILKIKTPEPRDVRPELFGYPEDED